MSAEHDSYDAAQHAAEIERLRDSLAARLPDLDPHDLVLILASILRPFGSGKRFLLRHLSSGGYAL